MYGINLAFPSTVADPLLLIHHPPQKEEGTSVKKHTGKRVNRKFIIC